MICSHCGKQARNTNSLLNHQSRCRFNSNAIPQKFTKATKSSGKNFLAMVEKNKSNRYKDEEVFVENSSYPRKDIKKRLIKNGVIAYKCSLCDNDGNHNGQVLVLQLDHINGVNDDHRITNLRFLCPNCHSQQNTYAAKNRKNDKRKPKKYL